MRLLPLVLLLSCTLSLFAQTEDWYTFSPANHHAAPSAIGLEDWSSEPAGTYGRIRMQGDQLIYNGKPIKLWGLNNTYGNCAPDKAMADKRAALYRKFGINAMRLHKYADGPGWQGIQSEDSFVDLTEEGLDRMDYYIHVLKQNGITTKLSPTFGVKFGPGDFEKVPYYEEIAGIRNNRVRAGHGTIFLSKELQDLQIAQTIQLLNHTNAYTGLRYADDPAIFCVELFNEDSVLFFGTNSKLQGIPTLRERTAQSFSAWLLEKYGSDAAWEKAWGPEQIVSNPNAITNEHLNNLVSPKDLAGSIATEKPSAGTVIPWGTSWFYDAAMKEGSGLEGFRTRFLDTMIFLIGLQDEFYERYTSAIRATGFDGEIIASNWQAGSLVGHFLNLYSDARIGMIDRHNYFGGGRGAMNGKNAFSDGSMVARPGMGSLSASFQQVKNRAFMLSEWIHVQPNEWYAEGPALMGAYGWGLQGWDVSYIFQNTDSGEFSNRIGAHAWDVANPAVLAVYATVSRQVRRMDVVESQVTKSLNVHLPSLKEGKMSFLNQTTQAWDEKSFTTDKVPMEALAAVRVAVDFTEDYQETPAIDLTPYEKAGGILSSTGQLFWQPAEDGNRKDGYVLINTPATKAFIGFAPGGETFQLGDGYTITPEKGFAVIHLSAKGEKETLANASEIVVTAMARARNSGMSFNEAGNRVTNPGKSPILLEPVRAVIQGPFNGTLEVLDQDGTAPTATRPIQGRMTLDGAQDKTPFYLIRK